MQRLHPPADRGFTLIELLVVLVVIALLVAILLPTLAAARGTARAAVCLSNQRQMTFALLAYTQEHDDSLVTYGYAADGGVYWWFGFEPGGPGSGRNRPLETQRSPLARYFGGDLQLGLRCPAFPNTDPRFYPKFATSSAHYGYNGGLVRPSPLGAAPKRLREVVQPSDVFAFADAVHTSGSSWFFEPHAVAYRRPGRVSGVGHYRHAGRLNLAMLDGHAETIERPASETVWDTIAGAPTANLDTTDGAGSRYGFATWTAP